MEIKCKFGNETWELENNPTSVYTCSVTSCSIQTRNLAVSAFKGVHKGVQDNRSVMGLSFEGAGIDYMPRNLSTIFPNLSFLLIDNCGLKEVSAEDMVGLEKLEAFWVPNNKIETLPVELFEKMTEVKEVDFHGNLIQRFDWKVLEPIKATIQFFALSDNPGLNEVFEKDSNSVENFIKMLKLSETNEVIAKNLEMNSKRLENLFTSGKHADFTIEAGDKAYRVHKCILASLSSVFDGIFSNDASLPSKKYENIGNVGHAAIEEFLRYFYTKATPSEENVYELLKLAVDFDVPDLKLQCQTIIGDKTKPENAHDLFKVAVRHSLQDLKRKAFAAIQECYPEIGDYLYDKPKVVSDIIEAKHEHEAKKIKLEKKD